MDGTARLANVQSKRILGKLVHSGAKPFSQVDIVQASGTAEDGHTDDGESLAVEAVGFAHTHNFCATAGIDGIMKIWDLLSMTARHSCVHNSPVLKLTWSVTEAQVVTGAVDGNIRLWDALTGTCLTTLSGHTDTVLTFTVFAQQGKAEEGGDGASSVGGSGMLVLTGSDDDTAKLFIC
jgi:WD40 repeat protein